LHVFSEKLQGQAVVEGTQHMLVENTTSTTLKNYLQYYVIM